MKLLKEDKKMLLNWGYLEEDLKQIQRAINKTNYILTDKQTENKITSEKAKDILGTEKFLSGISRSAFHWSAMRDNIYFDSRKLFN